MRYETTVSGGRHELRGLLRPCGEKRFGGAGCQRRAGKSARRQHGGRVRRKRVRRTDDCKGGRVRRLHGCGGRRQADIGSGAKPAGGRGAEENEDPYYRFGDFHACPDVLLDGRDGRAAAAVLCGRHGRHVQSGAHGAASHAADCHYQSQILYQRLQNAAASCPDDGRAYRRWLGCGARVRHLRADSNCARAHA